ncbi:MAG: hypothetical protein ACPGO5_02805 [Patescibacteria group bacterium]
MKQVMFLVAIMMLLFFAFSCNNQASQDVSAEIAGGAAETTLAQVFYNGRYLRLAGNVGPDVVNKFFHEIRKRQVQLPDSTEIVYLGLWPVNSLTSYRKSLTFMCLQDQPSRWGDRTSYTLISPSGDERDCRVLLEFSASRSYVGYWIDEKIDDMATEIANKL